MTLNFPNESRSYDERRDLIRFWGHDSALEISFFVEAGALQKMNPGMKNGEAGCLEAFDSGRELIQDVARKLYSKGRKDMYFLEAEDF